MQHYLYGAAFTMASRVMSGESSIDGDPRRVIESMAETMDEVSRTVGDLSIHRPGTWAGFTKRLLQRSLDQRSCRDVDEWLEREGYAHREFRLVALWREVCQRAPKREVFRDGRHMVMKVDLGDAHFYLMPKIGESMSGEFDGRFAASPEPALPTDKEAREGVYNAVADFFWRDRTIVLLDHLEDIEHFVTLDPDGTEYIGPLEDRIDVWRDYREEGVRRNVLLQGHPGTGKSTFAREAARRLSERTVVLSPDATRDISASDWHLMLEALAPEMVIVDDVDRLGDYAFEDRLRMFEEGHCDVPFVIFTSNDHLKLPQPMRRPGRIDEIHLLDEPRPEARRQIIDAMAAREQVEVPDDQYERLERVARDFSIAHVVEILRRARVEGWDADEPDHDITFGEGFDLPDDPPAFLH